MRTAAVLGLLLFAAAPAYGDGAFPDEMQIFLPADQPHRIIVTTTFGILESQDDGSTWRWVCEQAVTSQLTARLYQIGPAPQHVLYAATNQGISISRDDACNWSDAGGVLTKAFTPDVFPDPTTGSQRVLAIATPQADAAFVPSGIYRSTDAGATWESMPLFTDDMGGLLKGVEIAASDPQTIYLTMTRPQPPRPFLVRSTDGGTNWTKIDLASIASGLDVLLVAIDPQDANKVYLRAIDTQNGDKLIITTDGGGTFRVAATIYGPYTLPDGGMGVGGAALTAFVRRADGTILLGTRIAGGKISTDGGMTFQTWTGAPRARALAERDGALYACGDNWLDQFAVGVSHDGGAHWQSLLRFDQICGVKQCPNIQTMCAGPWNDLVTLFEIPPTVCGQTPPDGGGGSGGGGGGGGGCGCSVGGRAGADTLFLLVAVLAIGVSRRSLRRRRP